MEQDATEKKLTPAQRQAIEALLTHGTVTAAAKAASISRTTLWRWTKEAHFVLALQEAEQEAVAGLSRGLAGLGDSAAAALKDALGEGQKITVRLRASEIVLGHLLKLRELVTLEERVAELEKRYARITQED